MNTRKPGQVNIPLSELGRELAEAARLKREASELLRQIEERYIGHAIDRPGAWRHDPLSFRTGRSYPRPSASPRREPPASS